MRFSVRRRETTVAVVSFLLFLANHVSADVLFKTWDRNAAVISHTAAHVIPAAFQPVGRAVYIESISQEEAYQLFALLYPSLIARVPDIAGLYLPRPSDGQDNLPPSGSMIFIFRTYSEPVTERIITHEYGHFVYFELLTPLERQQWSVHWQFDDLFNTHPTAYAGTNKYEGFAEAFRLYVYHDPRLSPGDNLFFERIGKRIQRKPVKKISPPQYTDVKLNLFGFLSLTIPFHCALPAVATSR